MSTNPILAGPTLGIASATALNMGTDSTGIPKIGMFGVPANNFEYDGFASLTNTLAYHVAGPANNHIFYAAASSTTRTELFRVKGSGGFTSNGTSTVTGDFGVTGFVAAAPRYGIRTKGSRQTVSSGGSAAITWTDSATGPLTSNGASYINNTSSTLVVMIYYTILWDVSFAGGTVAVTVRTGVGAVLSTAYAPVFSTTGSATCSGSVIHSVAPTDTFFVEAFNFLGSSLDLIGGGPNTCKMGYYILN